MTQCPRGYIMSADGVCQKNNGYSTGGLMRNTMRPSARRRRNINPDPQPMIHPCQAAYEHHSTCIGVSGIYSSPIHSNYMGCQCGCIPMGSTNIMPGSLQEWFQSFYCYCHSNQMAGVAHLCSGGGGSGIGYGGYSTGGQGAGRGGFRKGGPIKRRRRR